MSAEREGENMNRSRSSGQRVLALTAAGATALALAIAPASAATAAPAAKCDNRNNNTIAKLLECVSADGAMEHLEAFQQIAEDNDGNRAVATSGSHASADYLPAPPPPAGRAVP